jgi:hypothetical protein
MPIPHRSSEPSSEQRSEQSSEHAEPLLHASMKGSDDAACQQRQMAVFSIDLEGEFRAYNAAF